jgi:hypothetical protein
MLKTDSGLRQLFLHPIEIIKVEIIVAVLRFCFMSKAREQLMSFINKKAFDPIINASADKYDEKDRGTLEDIQRKTENEKKQFEKEFTTAEKVKDGFLSDVRSKSAVRLNHALEHLKLPTLPSIKDEFMELCKKLDV